MIAVAGGSGVLGSRLVSDLVARGFEVRALVRDGSRATEVLGVGPQITEVDVRRPEGLVEALSGVSVVVSAFHGLLGGYGAGPAEVDVRGNANLTAAARVAGAHFVLVSVIGAAADSGAELLVAKHRAEQALRSSGVPWTIVRAGPFLETWVRIMRESAGSSGRPLVLGRGDRPLPFVSVEDVSAVVLRAVTDPHERGRLHEIGGEPTSMFELAEAVQAADGRTAAPRRLPRAALRLSATLSRPFSPSFARMSRMALLVDTRDLGTGEPQLRERLGLPPAIGAHDLLAGRPTP